jgi:hypothetical protein
MDEYFGKFQKIILVKKDNVVYALWSDVHTNVPESNKTVHFNDIHTLRTANVRSLYLHGTTKNGWNHVNAEGIKLWISGNKEFSSVNWKDPLNAEYKKMIETELLPEMERLQAKTIPSP